MRKDFAVVVLGGGPAGAVCALRLADRGVPTLLVDKATFPREKVCGCCLNLSGVKTLRQIGLGGLPGRLGAVELHHWHARCGKTDVRCPLPGGFALSRYRLDDALLQQAAAAGVVVRTGTLGTIEEMTDERVSVRLQIAQQGDETPSVETVTASTAIVATGLSGGGLERWLPYQKRPSGPFGAGLNVTCEPGEFPAGTVFMACGTGGYVGAVRIEDGTLDVAAALTPPMSRRQKKTSPPLSATDAWGQGLPSMPEFSSTETVARESLALQMMRIVEQAGFPVTTRWEEAPGGVRTTPRLRRARRVGCGRLIAIGDAAEYVEPFTGEGMAWAMSSGMIAAETVAERIDNRPELLGEQWLQTCQKLLRRRKWPCRLVATALQSRLGRRSLFGSLHRMPWLAKPVIRYMNQAGDG